MIPMVITATAKYIQCQYFRFSTDKHVLGHTGSTTNIHWAQVIKFLPFYTCDERWALHVVIKRKFFYIYI